MRILSIILLSAIVGTALGAGLAYVDIGPVSEVQSGVAAGPGNRGHDASQPHPRVEIDQVEFNFGTMQRGTTRSHEFMVTNAGTAPLTLEVGPTSCKCALGEVADGPIAPGETVPVRLEWTAKTDPGPFRQTATIITNDARQSRLELSVVGEVTEPHALFPREFMYDKIAAGEEKTAEVFLMSFTDDEVEIHGAEILDPQIRKHFEVDYEPTAADELPHPKATSGVRVKLTAKAGLPIGSFYQWLVVETNLPETEKLEIPVIGRVVGDITIHGRGWNEENGVLRLGLIKSREGKDARLNIVIRGEQSSDVEMEVASTDPPEMTATLGEPRQIRDDLRHVPLEISIPRGLRPMVRQESPNSEDGQVVLTTTHPDAPELKLKVRFAVER